MTAHPVLRPTLAEPVPAGPFSLRPLRLGFLSPHDCFDRRAFSGTVFHAARALAATPGVDLRILGRRPPGRLGRYLPRRRRAPGPVDTEGLDAVVGLVATRLLDGLPGAVPFLHVTDATPAFLRETYGWTLPEAADAAETRVAARAACTVYSSAVIAARAPLDLNLPGLAPATVPFGVNFEQLPAVPLPKQSLTRPNLLFVGKDWTRKGGDIALGALDLLRAGGIEARLTVAGAAPRRLRRHPGICLAGFLDKNRPAEAARLSRLYAEAHLLLLPTRGDCTPMVVAEAMAHGTPVLASDTGGIPDLLGGAGTGRLLPLAAGAGDWAREVRGSLADPEAYLLMADAAAERARTRLSWTAWAADIAALARAAAQARRVAAAA